MNPPKKIGIVGVGAVGGYYGASLARAGFDVHFLARSNYDALRNEGLTVISPKGDFVLSEISVHDSPRQMPECDIVLICTKSTTNAELFPTLAPMLAPHGYCVLIQNGLLVEKQLAKYIREDSIISGLSFICAYHPEPTVVQHLDYGMVMFGEYTASGRIESFSPNLIELTSIFQRAGIEVHLSEDLQLARWKKLLWNIPYNGLSVILNATTRQLVECTASRELIQGLMTEVRDAAERCGAALPEDTIQWLLEGTSRMTDYAPTMKRDYDARRPLELEAIYRAPLRVAKQHGAAMPRTEMLCEELTYLESRYRG